MIIFLICLAMFLIGLVICAFVLNDRYYKESIEWLGVILLTFGLVASALSTLIFCLNHVGIQKQITQSRIERTALEAQIEMLHSEYEDISAITVIHDVAEWNNEVYKHKYYLNSLWTNWYESKEYVDSLEYIYFDGIFVEGDFDEK